MTVLEIKKDTPETEKRPTAISLENVLYATDFSATSESAFPYATAICRAFGSTLHIAHVFSDTTLMIMTAGADNISYEALYDDARTLAQQKVDQIATRLGEIPNRTYVRHGVVWENLSEIVASNKIDLIIVGTHGRGGLGKLLLGSVAEDILRHAPCPVLTVGPGVCGHAKLREVYGASRELAPAELEPLHILYATNSTPEGLRAVQVAVSLAAHFDARLTLMHVFDCAKQECQPESVEEEIRKLREEVAKGIKLPYQAEVSIDFGCPWKCIVKRATGREADLIVLGAQSVDGTTHLPWSTVHHVVAHANCPVLTVPAYREPS